MGGWLVKSLNILILVLFSFLLVSASPNKNEFPRIQQPEIFLNFADIRNIQCLDSNLKEGYNGTASIINSNTLVTSDHIVVSDLCFDMATGVPLKPFFQSKEQDISLLRIPVDWKDQTININCNGLKVGKTYTSLGYPFGKYFVMTKLKIVRGTEFIEMKDRKVEKLTKAKGTIIPGMSGGPVLNEKGEMVGINAGTNLAYGMGLIRDLKDTDLCKKN